MYQHPQNKFKYDVVELLKLVRDRPCLWDKYIDDYKNLTNRKNAWREICNSLENNYERMSWVEQKRIGDIIQNKWTNIRDTFVRSLKTKYGKPKSKYCLYDNLTFLFKVVTPEEDVNASFVITQYNEEHDSNEQNTISNTSFCVIKEENEEPNSSLLTPRQSKRKHSDEDHVSKRTKANSERRSLDSESDTPDNVIKDNINFIEIDPKLEDARLMNEDEAFFASLLPTVVKYNEGEKLEFRMQVLKAMRNIFEKKNGNGT